MTLNLGEKDVTKMKFLHDWEM